MILPDTTNKQKELVLLIPRFRFLDRTHIQHFLHHKDKQQINRWLKDLTEKEYVKRIYDNAIIGTNRIPAIYSLGNNGIRFLKAQGIGNPASLHKLYFEKVRSNGFIQHSLLIASICCDLEQKNSDTLHYEYVTESDYSDSNSEFYFLKESGLTVDLCFSKKEKGKKIKYFLLTLFDETLPKYRIRKRIRDYYQFYFDNDWEDAIGTSFPIIFFVFQTKERMIYAKRFTKTLFEDDKPDDLFFNFATTSDVKQYGVTGRIWE